MKHHLKIVGIHLNCCWIEMTFVDDNRQTKKKTITCRKKTDRSPLSYLVVHNFTTPTCDVARRNDDRGFFIERRLHHREGHISGYDGVVYCEVGRKEKCVGKSVWMWHFFFGHQQGRVVPWFTSYSFQHFLNALSKGRATEKAHSKRNGKYSYKGPGPEGLGSSKQS